MPLQKVVFPTGPRGIDVGAKTDVYHLIGKMAQQGLGAMFSSSELDEVMALADRILVMADGRITRRFTASCGDPRKLILASTPSRLIRLEPIMNQKYMIYMYLLEGQNVYRCCCWLSFFSVMVPEFPDHI